MSECVEYVRKEDALRVASDVFFETDPDGKEQLVALKCSRLIRELPIADAVPGELFRELRDELCLYCGRYTEQHLGACDGCKWRVDNE